MEGGAKGVLEVAATCAGAGIIIGVMALTGLGVRISSTLIACPTISSLWPYFSP